MVPSGAVGDFDWLTAIAVESLVRLEASISRQRLISKKPEYHAILEKMVEVCSSYKSVFFDHVGLFNHTFEGGAVSAIDQLKIRQVLRHSAGAFLALHELALFLPRESIRHELVSYCECLFREEFKIERISIILTSVFNAFEYSLDDVMKILSIDVFRMKIPNPDDLPFGHVMELAVVDRDNPLSWAILAHEFGHYIDHTAGMSKAVAKEFVDNTFKSAATPQIQRTFERIGDEIVADLTAYYLLGPCGIAPILSMSLLAGLTLDQPIPFDNVHPLPATRFQILADLAARDNIPMDWLNPLHDALLREETRKEAALTDAERLNRKSVDEYIRYFCNHVQDFVLQELQKKGFRKFLRDDFDRSIRLLENLRQGLPIGAARGLPDEEIRQRLFEGDLYADDVDHAARFNLLKEGPVNPAEVLTAGWLFKIERTPSLIREAFKKDTDNKVFEVVASFVGNTDGLLLTSFEMISNLEKTHDSAGR